MEIFITLKLESLCPTHQPKSTHHKEQELNTLVPLDLLVPQAPLELLELTPKLLPMQMLTLMSMEDSLVKEEWEVNQDKDTPITFQSLLLLKQDLKEVSKVPILDSMLKCLQMDKVGRQTLSPFLSFLDSKEEPLSLQVNSKEVNMVVREDMVEDKEETSMSTTMLRSL